MFVLALHAEAAGCDQFVRKIDGIIKFGSDCCFEETVVKKSPGRFLSVANEETIKCQRCHRTIGKIVMINHQEWLSINGIAVTVMRGVCECGEEFHWSISERMLAKLIDRVNRDQSC